MTTTLTLDHIVLMVGELKTAVRQFNQMGFSVTPGGVHTGGLTHNALVSFADGTYLELMATTRRATQSLLVWLRRFGLLSVYTARDNALNRRFKAGIASGSGLSDYCLLSSNLDEQITTTQQEGLRLEGPIPGGRVRLDGQQIYWRTAVPSAVDLPFLIEDITSRNLRVPPAPPEGHANQVIGIAGITMGVRNLEECIDHYHLLIGADHDSTNRFPMPGIQSVEFPLGVSRLSLVQPGRALPEMRKALGRRLARPLIIWLSTPALETSSFLELTNLPGKGLTLSRGNPFE